MLHVERCTRAIPCPMMQAGDPIVVARPSLASLSVWPRFDGTILSSATAFVVGREEDPCRWLITNWHVVTGRDPATGSPLDRETGGVPTELLVAHHIKGRMGNWEPMNHPLYDPEGNPLWLEHPNFGRQVDVVALPIEVHADGWRNLDYYGYDPWHEDTLDSVDRELPVQISGPISIIGFPFGQTGGGWLPVWTRGWVATEPDVDLDGLPLLLVDARTRHGQSGSPVIAYSPGGPTALAGGAMSLLGQPVERFVGVYSGRLNEEADIGRVWKRHAVVEVVDGAKRGPLP